MKVIGCEYLYQARKAYPDAKCIFKLRNGPYYCFDDFIEFEKWAAEQAIIRRDHKLAKMREYSRQHYRRKGNADKKKRYNAAYYARVKCDKG